MAGGWECAHLHPDLGDQGPGDLVADAGHGLQELDLSEKGNEHALDLRVQGLDRLVGRIDLIQVRSHHEPVMRRDASVKRRGQALSGGLQARVRQAGQRAGVGLARNQRLQHRPATDANDVADDRTELDVGILQRLRIRCTCSTRCRTNCRRVRVRSRSS